MRIKINVSCSDKTADCLTHYFGGNRYIIHFVCVSESSTSDVFWIKDIGATGMLLYRYNQKQIIEWTNFIPHQNEKENYKIFTIR